MRALNLIVCLAFLWWVGLTGCSPPASPTSAHASSSTQPSSESSSEREGPPGPTRQADEPTPGLEVAIFAGGCFWCMEGPMERLPGVVEALSGYTGGPEVSPSYRDVAGGRTGHTEAVWVIFDPSTVTYRELVEVFWRSMDPTDDGGQFADRGPQYRPAIFYRSAAQREQAEASREALRASGRFDRPIVVPIQPAEPFWIAEEEHQNYYRRHPAAYQRYYRGSGRAGFLERLWGDDR